MRIALAPWWKWGPKAGFQCRNGGADVEWAPHVDNQAASALCLSEIQRNPMKKTGYESDLTKFMREFLERHPAQAEKQKQARATWWDKPEALEDLKREEDSKLPASGYVYYDNP
jgi:hypothetical protein